MRDIALSIVVIADAARSRDVTSTSRTPRDWLPASPKESAMSSRSLAPI